MPIHDFFILSCEIKLIIKIYAQMFDSFFPLKKEEMEKRADSRWGAESMSRARHVRFVAAISARLITLIIEVDSESRTYVSNALQKSGMLGSGVRKKSEK